MRKLYPVLFFAVVMVLAFWKVIFHPEFTLLTGGDMCAQSFPWLNVASYWLKRGIVLLWDPYVYAGKANLGELQPGTLYPLNWLFMLLPAPGGGINLEGMEALLIVHYFLAAYFFYLLARSFNLSFFGAAAAGISFSLGGYTTQIHAYMNIFSGFVWMPLVWFFFQRALLAEGWKTRYRWILWGGLSLSLAFLAGHHVPPVHTFLFLSFYIVFILLRDRKKSLWRAKLATLVTLGSMLVTAILITAPQWLASTEWARQVYRWMGDGELVKWGQKIPYSVLQGMGNLSPQDVVSLLLPYVSSSVSIYVGSTVLFLALVGLLFVRSIEARFFGSMAFLYLFLSWGRFSPLHGWVNTFIPGVWFARGVDHYLVPFQACLALLAGWGLDYLVESYASSPDGVFRVFIRRAGWSMAFLVLVAGIFIAALVLINGMPMDHPYMTAAGSLATYLSVLGFLLFLLHTGRVQPWLFRILIIVVIVVDLSAQLSNEFRTKTTPLGQDNPSVHAVWKKPPAAEFLKSRRKQEYFRVDDPSQIFPPNYGDGWLLDATMGHGATGLVSYMEFRGTGWGPGSNASALLNVRYFPSRIAVPGMKKVFEDGDRVYFNPRAVPRAFVASRYRSFLTDGQILSWIQSPLLCPRETVLLREQDLEKLPFYLRRELRNENDGLEVSCIDLRTAADKQAAALSDEEARRNLEVFKPPWGWSAGDEVKLRLRPDKPIPKCYVVFNFYPTSSKPSRLSLLLDGTKGPVEIRLELPGLPGEGSVPETSKQSAIDLGPLDAAEYTLYFMKTEECSANIDSLRITKSIPLPDDGDAGTVSITSHKPNRLKLRAELKRSSLVVLSEVFYPGWEALLDGQRAPLLAGNYMLRTIPVPEGKHTIELRYWPKTFQWGLIISLLSLCGIAIFLATSREGSGQ